jgi:hypothetical protein
MYLQSHHSVLFIHEKFMGKFFFQKQNHGLLHLFDTLLIRHNFTAILEAGHQLS